MAPTLDCLRIGTRRSALALYQTHFVADALRAAHPSLRVEIIEIDTKGDKILDVPLPEIGGKGLFTFEIEERLLDRSIDLAVHSLKDLPSDLGEGLEWIGSPTRGSATDALVSTKWSGLDDLPSGATIATGSVRRRAQLLALRPDLEFVDLRGNIGTRLQKLTTHGWDAIIMATTALERLEMHEAITERLDPDRVVPAVSQGAIGVEIAQGRDEVATLLAPIFDEETTHAVRAERAFMALLEGGCSAPVAAHCVMSERDEGMWDFRGWVGRPDGTKVLTHMATGKEPIAMAETMARRFLDEGARDLIRPTST